MQPDFPVPVIAGNGRQPKGVLECCNAYQSANKMSQEPNCTQRYGDYFSRPEVLEEMRDHLYSLIQQESSDIDSLLLSLSNSAPSVEQGQGEEWRRVGQAMQAASEELRQRSSNLQSVASLAIQMIDYINDQTANYYHTVEHYQLEVDRLQNTIDQLNNRNTMIESDVEIFREQLQAARNELEEITEDREERGEQEQPDLMQSMIESKIQNLQTELERMRAQITFYKSSVFSRTSLKCHDQGISKDMVHTKSLLVLNEKNGLRCKREEEEMSISQQLERNRQLQMENQRLKNEIEGYRKSMLLRKEQRYEGNGLLGSELEEEGNKHKLLRVRTSSKNFIEDSSCASGFGFSDFFKLFKSKREERLEKLMKEQEEKQRKSSASLAVDEAKLISQLSLESLHRQAKYEDAEVNAELLQKPRHLSSEWSRDSLSVFQQQTYEVPELIYLTQQSQDNDDKADLFYAKPTSISENKETQSSLKADYNPPYKIKITMNKSYESVGINTSRDPAPLKQSTILQAVANSSFLCSLKEFIVGKRLKRRCKAANSGTSSILI